jgi:hypothetical protein
MANNTFLISTMSPEKPVFGHDRHKDRLLWASYSIPLFWYMLFDENAIVSVPSPRGGGGPYWALSTPSGDGLALARRRWPDVCQVLGKETDSLFTAWAELMEANAAAFLHCETFELSGMSSTKSAFKCELQTCIQAFDNIPPLPEGRPTLNRWWLLLLGQCAALGKDETIRPLGDFSYCGIGWALEVPWGKNPYYEND